MIEGTLRTNGVVFFACWFCLKRNLSMLHSDRNQSAEELEKGG